MHLVMPRLYVILDAGLMTETPADIARQMIGAGVRALQYRDKSGASRRIFDRARELAGIARDSNTHFFVNDRPDIAYLSGAGGVHVGQDDLGVKQARAVVGPDQWVGVSTHNERQFREAAESTADYIAVGPVFATSTKENPDPVVGLELVRLARSLTRKPIVAIGGITLDRAASVIEAGADSVAIISDILRAPRPAERAAEFLRVLRDAAPAARN